MKKMTESYIWDKLKDSIEGTHFTRHEDRTTCGIPDVSYGRHKRNGWIELKAYRMPLELSSVPSFRNFKRPQKKWLKKRGKTGDYCFLLIGFGENILLLDWKQVDLCGQASMEQLISKALFFGSIDNISGLKHLL